MKGSLYFLIIGLSVMLVIWTHKKETSAVTEVSKKDLDYLKKLAFDETTHLCGKDCGMTATQ